jgi:tetratricopeptide (TPR) repeat protein
VEAQAGPQSGHQSYPVDGTFATLLHWHVKIWGTRPTGNTREPGQPWTVKEFSFAVHGDVEKPENAERLVRLWLAGKEGPPKDHKLRLIETALFGENFDHCRTDLRLSRARSKRFSLANPPKRTANLPLYVSVPYPTEHFGGRDADVELLANALMSQDHASAILIQGGPGIGKTELTKATAHNDDIARRFGSARWFVSLESATSASAVESEIIRALDCDRSLGFAAVLESFKGQPSLIILDNLETPWEPHDQREATEQLLADLIQAPGVNVLASFRGREKVGGPKWFEHALEPLSNLAAATLFIAIAGPRASSDPDLYRFVDALGGIPLAIELVACRAHGRSNLAPLWREWTKIGADLAVRPGFDAARLTSLPHSIELSLRSTRVSAPALRLFRLLGALPSGIAYEDVEGLLGGVAFQAAEQLCHVGLAFERADRIDLLPPLREHSARHHPPGGADSRQWPKYYLAMTKHFGEDAFESLGDEALDRLLPEIGNIEAAMREALKLKDRFAAVDALPGLVTMREIVPINPSVLQELAQACAVAKDANGEAVCLQNLGGLALSRSDYAQAQTVYEEAACKFEMSGNIRGMAECYSGLGDAKMKSKSHDVAAEPIKKALQLFRKLGDKSNVASSLMNLGHISYMNKEYSAAMTYAGEGSSLFQELGHGFGEFECLRTHGQAASLIPLYDDAQASFEKALELCRKAVHPAYEADILFSLGLLAKFRRDTAAARAAFEQASVRYRESGDTEGEQECDRQAKEI